MPRTDSKSQPRAAMVSQFQGAAEISAMARQTHLRVLGLVFGLLFARRGKNQTNRNGAWEHMWLKLVNNLLIWGLPMPSGFGCFVSRSLLLGHVRFALSLEI